MDGYLRLTVLLVVIATVTVEGSSRRLGDTSNGDTQKSGFNFFGLWKGTSSDSKPAGKKDDIGFNLEDALHPAVKPSDKPDEGGSHGEVIQKLNKVIENQNYILTLLRQRLRGQ